MKTNKILVIALLFALIAPLSTYADLATGLLGYWSLDRYDYFSKTVLIDRSGNKNTGTLKVTNGFSATSTVTGQVRQALSFNGKSQYVAIPAPSWTLTNCTFTMWIYSNANQNSFTGLFYSRNTTGAPGLGISYGNPVTNQLGGNWNNAGSGTATGLIVPNNKWIFVARVVTSTSGGTYTYMGNGSSLQVSNDNIAVTSETFNGEVDIGSDITSVSTRSFNGRIDDVRVYNRALSINEVRTLYNQGLSSHAI